MSLFFPGLRNKPNAALGATVTLLILLLALPFIVGSTAGGNAGVRALAFAALYVMLALGLNIVVGFAGLLDLGYIAFYAVGAYMYALLASPHLTSNFPALAAMFPQGFHSSIWFVVPLGAAIAAFFGVVLGAPVLKLRGDYLAIVTLGFGEIIRIFLTNLNAPLNFTNGPQGITLIDPIRIAGINFGRTFDLGFTKIGSVYLYYYLFLLLTIITIVICIRLQDSRLGRAWMAIREDDIAAKAMGINVRNVKLLAFALGASFGGVSGAMFAAFQGFVSPESFSLTESISVLAMIVLGGLGHIPGVVLGAVLLALLPEVLRHTVVPVQMQLFGKVLVDAEVLRMLLYGLAMVLIMLYRPRGCGRHPNTASAARRARRHEGRVMADILLKVSGVNKRFGGLQALSDVGITIERGQIYGLIGPNGAGKTTFFNVITGLYTPDSGTFELDGKPYSPDRSAQGRAGRHRAHVPEHPPVRRHDGARERHGRPPRAAPRRTALGAVLRTKATRRRKTASTSAPRNCSTTSTSRAYADFQARTLPYGDQRRLEIARALATDPKLLALDEPAAGMNATEKRRAARTARRTSAATA